MYAFGFTFRLDQQLSVTKVFPLPDRKSYRHGKAYRGLFQLRRNWWKRLRATNHCQRFAIERRMAR
jgi:hypothetical protein